MCADYRDLSLPQDHEYITHSRGKMLGRKLEEIQAGREDRLGSSTPNYADYRILGGFLFTASVCKTPVLAPDDPLRDWLDRCLDLHGGLGRHPGLFPLFGLEQREGDVPLFNRQGGLGGIYKRNTGPASTQAETQKITQGMKQPA